jgi:predicted PurR-regulated permease PerM
MNGPSRPSHSRPGALIAITAIGLALCAWIAAPFVAPLTWAFALAVVAAPFHRHMESRIRNPNIAATVSVIAVTLVLLLPTMFVAWQVGAQATRDLGRIQQYLDSGSLRDLAGQIPGGTRIYDALIAGREGKSSLLPAVEQEAGAWVISTVFLLFQILVAVFALFFMLRDRGQATSTVRSYLPMTPSESTYFFERIRTVAHATIYGSVTTAIVQGTLGGLMFALLGIPGALLWGVVMALLSMIPSAGAFIVWIPAAIILGAQGDWTRAAILVGWGTLVVGTIDNVLYPWLVGKEVRLHQLAVFVAIVGGLLAFGAAGLVLGPLVAAATMALLDIVQQRAHTRLEATTADVIERVG